MRCKAQDGYSLNSIIMQIAISKTDLRNIISQLDNYISLGGETIKPVDTAARNRIRMATVLKRKLEKKLSLSS